jgi:hypothetical protein
VRQDAYNRLPLMVRDIVARWNATQHRSAATLDEVVSQAGGLDATTAWMRDVVPDARTRRLDAARRKSSTRHTIIPGASSAMRAATSRRSDGSSIARRPWPRRTSATR